MRISELTRINEAPVSGMLLVYSRDKVLFEEYCIDSISACFDKVAQADLLEIHMFDENKEYRAIMSESGLYGGNIIEYVADFENFADTVYKERVILENGGTIEVLNKISYDSNGMAFFDDYRMIPGGSR